jgi:UDP-N-acetylglucosamine--N-acetylmuramyl-(pentapeptide) pyrophosphoryl-undecaprenol N-acetylglucosamine transferase
MNRRPARILLAGGGTGGHVYPAIAVADAIRVKAPDSAVAFAGTTDRIEWDAVPRAGYPIYPIAAAGFARRAIGKNLTLPFKVIQGLGQSYRLVGDFDADVVVGTGGFVAGPVGLAGWMRGRPVLIQEQNAFAGATNRLLGRVAASVHIAFPEAKEAFPEGKAILSGNPIREDLLSANREEARASLGVPARGPLLLIVGGSLGSQALNEAVLDGLSEFLTTTNAHLVWQTGRRYHDRIIRQITPSGRVTVLEYLNDMAAAYASADLVLCRAGASTCSELLATGTPSILVPSPNVAEDHQTHNARSMVATGGAELLPEAALTWAWVSRTAGLLADGARLDAMGQAATRHAIIGSAAKIADSVLSLASRRAA